LFGEKNEGTGEVLQQDLTDTDLDLRRDISGYEEWWYTGEVVIKPR